MPKWPVSKKLGLNGKKLNRLQITYGGIMAGGVPKFVKDSRPNTSARVEIPLGPVGCWNPGGGKMANIGEIPERIASKIEALRERMVDSLCKLVEIEAVNPEYGGSGEARRAEYLATLAKELGIPEVRVIEVEDRKHGIKRPNIIATLPGRGKGRLWIIAHMDTVPAGDESQWEVPPFKATVKDGKVYGRGSEDNGQAIIASLYALHAIKDLPTNISVSIALVADEEAGSKYGLLSLMDRDLFSKEDLIYVPDHGEPDGMSLEIAEKGILWLKFTVEGLQAHASAPHVGKNATLEASRLTVRLWEALKNRFSKTDPLFDPPFSTFEPTKREKNVDNPNTIPGRDIFYFDCRVLPEHSLDEVLKFVGKMCRAFEAERGVRVRVEVVMRADSAGKVEKNCVAVQVLKEAIKLTRGREPKLIGIGGGTCAGLLRARGLKAVVWETIDCTAHSPNEYARINNLVEDAKVFAILPFLVPTPQIGRG